MTRIITLIATVILAMTANAQTFSYRFSSTTLPKAIQKVMEDHPDLDINFIYNELENYRTSATVHADNAYDALRQLVGLNPVTVTKSKNSYYVEALQHGKYVYTGRVIGNDREPVVAATIMLLAPKDSTVLTYGITDDSGHFSIPCDRQGVLAKLSCVGYKTTYRKLDSFNVGTILMAELPIELKAVTVEGENASLLSDRSIYRPTQRQKNASQSGGELLNRMALPQLGISAGDEVKTASGQSVDIFIDFLPASVNDLKGMRMGDVKLVEYYDYPTDPRFMSKPHVVNFIMQQYEYGGYVKDFAEENLMSKKDNSGQNNIYAKLQYKKMTYDVAAGGYYMNSDHTGYQQTEQFRLPQADSSFMEFNRNSEIENSQLRNRSCWASAKVLYRTDKISLNNMVSFTTERLPKNNNWGFVSYDLQVNPSDSYTYSSHSGEDYISYNGNLNFTLPKGNTLYINPFLAYSHSTQYSDYNQQGDNSYINEASDDTHQGKIYANFSHSFGSKGTVSGNLIALMYNSSTRYAGTSQMNDKAHTYRLGPGIMYTNSFGKLYAYSGIGLHWDRSDYGDTKVSATAPWADLSLQYAFNKKNSVSLDFHFHESIPEPQYRSASIVQSNPLMSYTGNPELRPYKSYDLWLSYKFIPSNKFTLNVNGGTWTVQDRYTYDYIPTSNGILRTISQPMGTYALAQYGLTATTRQFDGNLQISASITHRIVHNGAPFNWNRSNVYYYVMAFYYLRNFNFGVQYLSPDIAESYNCVSGTWGKTRSRYHFEVGWSNSSLNLRLLVANFCNWNWRGTSIDMESKYYSFHRRAISSSSHAMIKLSATYTFGFGKKVERRDEAYQQSGISSGILK